jgi:amino acid adenylation domain-containing protein
LSSPFIAEDLSRWASEDPERTALVVGDGEYSYGELHGLADRAASGLRERGVKRGDRVGIMLPNGIDAVVAIQATLRAGAAIMPINPTAKHDRVSDLLRRSEAALLLCDSERAGEAAQAVEAADGVPLVSDLDELASDAQPPCEQLEQSDLAALMHTSGSTGGPKGVMHSHGGLGFVTDSIAEYLELTDEDRVLNLLPLSFGYGLSHLMICMRVGATLVLEPGVGLPGTIVKRLEEHEITGLPGVPTVFALLLTLKSLAERPLPNLRFLTNAGAALPTPALEQVRKTFPKASLYSMYGQTECIRTCYLPPEQLDVRPGSVGVPIPGSETWIEDDEGNQLGPDVVGELCVRGPHVMQGYWQNPGATAQRVREGRNPGERVLATNDLFRTDEEGFLYFVGRRDDIIKSRGEKVPPREVEEVLHLDTGVHEAAVVGVPDRLLGEAVHAHVSPREGKELDPAALKRLCAEHLEDYMVPQRIVIHDELPRNQNNKVDRLGLAQG